MSHEVPEPALVLAALPSIIATYPGLMHHAQIYALTHRKLSPSFDLPDHLQGLGVPNASVEQDPERNAAIKRACEIVEHAYQHHIGACTDPCTFDEA